MFIDDDQTDDREESDGSGAVPFIVLTIICIVLVIALFACLSRMSKLEIEAAGLKHELLYEQDLNRALETKVQRFEHEAEFEIVPARVVK